jgi:hypothetical protein
VVDLSSLAAPGASTPGHPALAPGGVRLGGRPADHVDGCPARSPRRGGRPGAERGASLRASTVEWTASVASSRPDAAVADADTVLVHRHHPVPASDSWADGAPPAPTGGRDRDGSPTPTVPVDVNAVHALSAAARAGITAGDLDHGAAVRPRVDLAVRVAVGVGVAYRGVVLGVRGDAAAVAPALDGEPRTRRSGSAPVVASDHRAGPDRTAAPRTAHPRRGGRRAAAGHGPVAARGRVGHPPRAAARGDRLVATDLKSTNGTIVRGASARGGCGGRVDRRRSGQHPGPRRRYDHRDPPGPRGSPESTPTRQQAAP